MKTPIALNIDDPAPVVSVYHAHAGKATTEDGRPLVADYPNELLFRFCDVAQTYGLRGKFSVVPMAGNRGDLVRGFRGVPRAASDAWIACVRSRLAPAFSIGPEMLTHNLAVYLATGADLPQNERDWASTQNRDTLTPYIAKALSLLTEAGFSPSGVTSPWDFGIEVENDYQEAISAAMEQVTGRKTAWFFLRTLRDRPNAKPWVALDRGGRTLISIPATLRDRFWVSIDTPRTDDEFICAVADRLLSADGTRGEILDVLDTGGWPVLHTHWQSLMSNGLGTGIQMLETLAQRIDRYLSDRVEWRSYEEILDLVLSDKAAYPKPIF